jgi:hypothetical protein
MARIDHSNLERIQTPRDRVRSCFENALVLSSLGAVGWFLGASLLELTSHGGLVAIASAIGAAVAAFLWFWWSSWSSRAKLFCAVVLAFAIAVPFAAHYA